MLSAWGIDDGAVSKADGSWQTIDQRELKAGRARKIQRRAGTVASAGAGAALAGHIAHPEETASMGRHLKSAVTLARGGHTELARSAIKAGFKKNPVGAVTLGGAALAAGGTAAWMGARSAEGYQQHRINARRKHNAGISKALFPGTTAGAVERMGAVKSVLKPMVNRASVSQKMSTLPKPPKMFTALNQRPQPARTTPSSAVKLNTGSAMIKRPMAGGMTTTPKMPGGSTTYQVNRGLTRNAKIGIGAGAVGAGGYGMSRRSR